MRIPSIGEQWFNIRSWDYTSYKGSCFPALSLAECRESRIKVQFWLLVELLGPVNTLADELMNCYCGMVDRRKAFSLISSRDHCQRSSPSWISDTPRAGFEPAQNLSSGFVEWSCAVVITTAPRLRKDFKKQDLSCIQVSRFFEDNNFEKI